MSCPRILLFITKQIQKKNSHGWISLMPDIALPHPSLYTQKILAGLEHRNGEIKPKSRRRWGLISRSTKDSDDWAELDDLDFNPSFTRIDLKNKNRQSDDALCR
jgi:MAK-like kinase